MHKQAEGDESGADVDIKIPGRMINQGPCQLLELVKARDNP